MSVFDLGSNYILIAFMGSNFSNIDYVGADPLTLASNSSQTPLKYQLLLGPPHLVYHFSQ